jgi:hypothetical protein
MRKTVAQSIHGGCREADAKETATDCRIPHYVANLIQTIPRHFGIYVQEPENVASCAAGSGIHLCRTAAFVATDKLIAKSYCEMIGTIAACSIDNDDFGSEGSFPQMGEEGLYQRRLIKNGNNNGDLHLTSVAGLLLISHFYPQMTRQQSCSTN